MATKRSIPRKGTTTYGEEYRTTAEPFMTTVCNAPAAVVHLQGATLSYTTGRREQILVGYVVMRAEGAGVVYQQVAMAKGGGLATLGDAHEDMAVVVGEMVWRSGHARRTH